LMLARLAAIVRAMRDAFRTVAALRSALSTRGNLLLEIPCRAPSAAYTRPFGSALPPV
jgi:hypothetical protein